MTAISRRKFVTTAATAAGAVTLGCSDRSIIAPPLARLTADPLPDPAASGIEHALLQGQVIAGRTLFGAPVPTSILQLWMPRLELHLFYNTVVFVPMIVAMYYHVFPSAPDAARMQCGCALRSHPATA